MKRRDFVRTLGATGLTGLVGFERLAAQSSAASPYGPLLDDATSLVILHTNDTHSRMDPFPIDGGRFEGLGGAARRATLIRRVRDANPHVLLVDSGDIFQGTPYFNFFGGEIEFRAMTAMGYDVATLGNHDFDNGVDGLVEMLPFADFEFVSANYDVSRSALRDDVAPWTVREFGGVKVGVFGLGIAFEGLVLSSLHEGVEYTDPVEAARRTCRHLRREGCALIVCLSHLGYRYRNEDRPSDDALAREVPEIDLILGGHTHTFMEEPDAHPSREGAGFTLVNQVGWGGMRVGRIDVSFDATRQASAWSAVDYVVDRRLET